MLIKKAMPTIEMCEDCCKRPAEVEIRYSNHDLEPLCKKCYIYALKDTINRSSDRNVADLVEMMRIMVTLRVIAPES